ncbi:MAG TPA: hypothetical protein DCS97_10850 [Planctomycetes bacterium]|nr:hypothetical protein [Planctomycetota bacterium]
MPLGNGVQGLLIWGDSSLLLTVARAGFWDHRNGHDIPAGTTFAAVRRALEAEDDQTLAALFPKRAAGAAFPQQMGGGRLEITFTPGLRPISATLDPASAEVFVSIARHEDDPAPRRLRIRQAAADEVCWIDGDDDLLASLRIRLHAAFHLVRDQAMAALAIAPPEAWEDPDGCGGGFVQTLPADVPLAIAWKRTSTGIRLASALGTDAAQVVRSRLGAFDAGLADAARLAFWARYWAEAARVTLPDPALQEAFDLGLYRQAGLIRRHAPAATLQGPWMEDTTIPPWSNDYHFNINVQMIYQPGLRLGRAQHFQPLWDLLRGWMPGLRAAGQAFFNDPDALLLPHAVDDRCQVVGAFWTGMIDHACTGWMGLLAFETWRHDGDARLLADLVWPLLTGAHAGYRAMAEERDGRLSLPVSVSPEFKGARMDAWGRDASFQLACWHAVLRALPVAAAALGRPVDPQWAATAARLPAFTTVRASRQRDYPEKQVERIALWEGMDLIESHRHHSHLAGIWPFQTLDPADPVVRESLWHWTRTGPGAWSGWCVPWAAILNARAGKADGAVAWLRWWKDVFTNTGHGTLHDADFPGHSTLCGDTHISKEEIFQLDAGMGALSAICELLVQERDGVIHVLPALPARWRSLRFDGLHLPGGVRVGAIVQLHRVIEVHIESPRGGLLRLAHGLPAWHDGTTAGTDPVIERELAPGQTLVLRRAN